MSQKVSKYKFFFIISFIGFYAVAIHRCQFLHWYYIASCLFFPVWLFIYIVDSLNKTPYRYKILKKFTAISIFYTLFSNLFFWGYLTPTWFFKNSNTRTDFYKAAYYMSQIEKPTIIYYLCGTLGLETPVEGLPATTYWTTQIGATDLMMKCQTNSIKSCTADFIVAADNEEFPIDRTNRLIIQSGYHELMRFHTMETDFILYSKHHVKEPPKGFHVSNSDILLKRSIFGHK